MKKLLMVLGTLCLFMAIALSPTHHAHAAITSQINCLDLPNQVAPTSNYMKTTVVSNRSAKLHVAGWAVRDNGVSWWYYTIDGGTEKHTLNCATRNDVLNAYPAYKQYNTAKYVGFDGYVNLKTLFPGTHSITICCVDSKGKGHLTAKITIDIKEDCFCANDAPGALDSKGKKYSPVTTNTFPIINAGIRLVDFTVSGWAICELGKIDEFFYTVDTEVTAKQDITLLKNSWKARPLSFQPDRSDVKKAYPSEFKAWGADVGKTGYSGKISVDFTKTGIHTVHIYARIGVYNIEVTQIKYSCPEIVNTLNNFLLRRGKSKEEAEDALESLETAGATEADIEDFLEKMGGAPQKGVRIKGTDDFKVGSTGLELLDGFGGAEYTKISVTGVKSGKIMYKVSGYSYSTGAKLPGASTQYTTTGKPVLDPKTKRYVLTGNYTQLSYGDLEDDYIVYFYLKQGKTSVSSPSDIDYIETVFLE